MRPSGGEHPLYFVSDLPPISAAARPASVDSSSPGGFQNQFDDPLRFESARARNGDVQAWAFGLVDKYGNVTHQHRQAEHQQTHETWSYLCDVHCLQHWLETDYTPKRSSQFFRVLTQMIQRKYGLVMPPELCGLHPRGQLIPLRSCRWADAEWSARPSLLRTHSGNEQALCRRYGRDASESSSARTPGRL